MNSQNIIGIARHNRGVKGWCLNKTHLGRRIITNALESQYGKTEKILPNGVRKFVAFNNDAKKPIETITYVSPDNLQPCRTTRITYDEEWNRISLTSTAIDPKDKHRQTTINIADMPELGRRIYFFMVKSFQEIMDENQKKIYKWITEKIETTTVTKNANGTFSSKTIDKDLINLTNAKTDKTFKLN